MVVGELSSVALTKVKDKDERESMCVEGWAGGVIRPI